MRCEVLKVDPGQADPAIIGRAANVLRSGGLVAFPTETVYGLGANALDTIAVARIFEAKGRPATNPIIVHVASIDGAKAVAAEWPAQAQLLAERFWPGPLTLVVPKHECVSTFATAGGPTVAIRVPAHPVALALLREAAIPIAAPSANRSTELSPTLADHVQRGLGDRIDLLLDGGPTSGGLESTVLDVTTSVPRLLRPGLITIAALEAVIGPIDRPMIEVATSVKPARSPGQMQRHYAPHTPIEVVANSRERVAIDSQTGRRVAWLTHRDEEHAGEISRILLSDDPVSYSAQLYAALHTLDELEADCIIVETPPAGEDWLAVHDRLRRASN